MALLLRSCSVQGGPEAGPVAWWAPAQLVTPCTLRISIPSLASRVSHYLGEVGISMAPALCLDLTLQEVARVNLLFPWCAEGARSLERQPC